MQGGRRVTNTHLTWSQTSTQEVFPEAIHAISQVGQYTQEGFQELHQKEIQLEV